MNGPGTRAFFVDCEAYGPCPRMGRLTWFGVVHYETEESFDGLVVPSRARRDNPAIPEEIDPATDDDYATKLFLVFNAFDTWLAKFGTAGLQMVSDNPAYDWQWVNDGFWRSLNRNPFGFSARRIGDFYAGLVGDWNRANEWKSLRVTKHDHNPVNDARGNVEAVKRMLAGERGEGRRR